MKLIPYPNPDTLNETFHHGIQYSLINHNAECLHTKAFCKDFLHDYITCHIHRRSFDLYGFRYSPHKAKPLKLKQLKIAIHHAQADEIQKAIALIHTVEQQLQQPKRSETEPTDDPQTWVITPGPIWLTAPQTLSVLTTLIRDGLTYQPKTPLETFFQPEGNPDTKDPILESAPNLRPILYQRIRAINPKVQQLPLKRRWPYNPDPIILHNYSGWKSGWKAFETLLKEVPWPRQSP